MAFLIFLGVLGFLSLIGIVWNIIAMRREDREAEEQRKASAVHPA